MSNMQRVFTGLEVVIHRLLTGSMLQQVHVMKQNVAKCMLRSSWAAVGVRIAAESGSSFSAITIKPPPPPPPPAPLACILEAF